MYPQSKQLTVIKKKQLKPTIYELTFAGEDFSNVQLGQFINLKVDGKFLRRPISIMNVNKDQLVITFKVLGEGTSILSKVKEHDKIDVLYPLGTGFSLPDNNIKDIIIIAGGIGVPPLVGWYKYLKSLNTYNIKVVLGFKNNDFDIYIDEFENACVAFDNKDINIVEYMNKNQLFDQHKNYYSYACGAKPLLDKVAKEFENGQMLLEERMGCGFGACMGCSKKVSKDEYKRVCVEGPMFYNEEVRYGLES